MKNPFSGVNKFCMPCSKKCKQFANVTVVVCPLRDIPKVADNSKVLTP